MTTPTFTTAGTPTRKPVTAGTHRLTLTRTHLPNVTTRKMITLWSSDTGNAVVLGVPGTQLKRSGGAVDAETTLTPWPIARSTFSVRATRVIRCVCT